MLALLVEPLYGVEAHGTSLLDVTGRQVSGRVVIIMWKVGVVMIQIMLDHGNGDV